MEEKTKTVDMFGLDPSLDTYYDEEEQENVGKSNTSGITSINIILQPHSMKTKKNGKILSLKRRGNSYTI